MGGLLWFKVVCVCGGVVLHLIFFRSEYTEKRIHTGNSRKCLVFCSPSRVFSASQWFKVKVAFDMIKELSILDLLG